MIGVVAAAATGDDGIVHTISFLRTPNYANSDTTLVTKPYHWTCVLDCIDIMDIDTPKYGQQLLAHGTLSRQTEVSKDWKYLHGTLIRIARVNNIFYASTTPFTDSQEDPSES